MVSVIKEQRGFVMEVRRIQGNDIERVMDIYDVSRDFMIKSGNQTQWPAHYPNPELLKSDVAKDGYVVVEDNEIIGVFVLSGSEEAYDTIDGAWLNDEPYGTIHRLASGGARKGVGQFILDWCLDKVGNIRIDTHEHNIPMRKLLEKNGYEYCGKVVYEGYGERLAFQKLKSK